MSFSVAIRADASINIGTGHVMRCLTLANALREQGADVRFLCREHPGHLLELIREHGHTAISLGLPVHDVDSSEDTHKLPDHAGWLGSGWRRDAEQVRTVLVQQHADWLVVDHYALDACWEREQRSYCGKIMVIDDLADRAHDCDLLLDQNLGRLKEDYRGLVAEQTEIFVGPRHALLRPEFAQWRPASLARRERPVLNHLLITMGGVDKDNATGRVLDALKDCVLSSDLRITVVMGPSAPWLQQVRELAACMPWPTAVLVGVRNIPELMASADFAIGAAGGTAWERCCLGLPSGVLVLAENQLAGASALAAEGGAAILHSAGEVAQYVRNLICVRDGVALLRRMGQAAADVTDGAGVFCITQRMVMHHV